MKKIIGLAGTLVLAVTALAGCSLDSSSSAASSNCTPQHEGLSTVSKGVLTVSAAVFPPFTKVEGTKLSGVEGQILDKVASLECLTVTAQPLDTGSVVSAAQNGRVDIAAGNWYCTAARAKVMALAGPVYGDQIGILSTNNASTFGELQGKTVGTVDGYNWNAEFKELYGQGLKIYPNATAMYNDFKAGRLDVAVDSFGSAVYANEQNGGKWTVKVPAADPRVAASVNPAQACFPVAKQNEALANAVIEDIRKIRADGTLAAILKGNGLDPSAANVSKLQLIG
jgi:polar amino acid transport system substrate-binding protein